MNNEARAGLCADHCRLMARGGVVIGERGWAVSSEKRLVPYLTAQLLCNCNSRAVPLGDAGLRAAAPQALRLLSRLERKRLETETSKLHGDLRVITVQQELGSTLCSFDSPPRTLS